MSEYLSLYLSSLVINAVSSHGHGRALLHTCLPLFLADGRHKVGMGQIKKQIQATCLLNIQSSVVFNDGSAFESIYVLSCIYAGLLSSPRHVSRLVVGCCNVFICM